MQKDNIEGLVTEESSGWGFMFCPDVKMPVFLAVGTWDLEGKRRRTCDLVVMLTNNKLDRWAISKEPLYFSCIGILCGLFLGSKWKS